MQWRAFLLRPEPEPRPLEAFTEYTTRWARPGGMEPRATFNTWSGAHQPPSHSIPSAVAGKVAALLGADELRAYKDALFAAYFTQNRTISDRAVLLDVAVEAGLDRARFDRTWHEHEDALLREVWLDYRTAIEADITGVPAVVLDRTWLIPGAVDTEQYVEAIEHALTQRAFEG